MYAGFWRRFAALLIDTVILLAIVNIADWSLWFLGLVSAPKSALSIFKHHFQVPAIIVPFHPFILILGWPYFALLESSTLQVTIGKTALSIQVTDSAGGRITFWQATARYWAKFISAFFTGMIGFLMAAFTERKQALHDMIARCVVVMQASTRESSRR